MERRVSQLGSLRRTLRIPFAYPATSGIRRELKKREKCTSFLLNKKNIFLVNIRNPITEAVP